MKYQKIAARVYLVNLALLATHEIDSAFWHEWNLFNLPGGIDLFLVLNLVLILLFLFGFERVAKWGKGTVFFSYLLAVTGIFAFAVHSYFLLNGHPEFKTIISFVILLLTFITSVVQLVVLQLLKR